MEENALLLFDGVCNLCNGFVRFVHKRDKVNQFRFLSLQSSQAESVLANYNYDSKPMNSFLLLHNGTLYEKSSAALQVAKLLGFPYRVASVCFIVPKGIRDAVYTFVAQNRYKWFGKSKEVCEYDPEFTKKMQWNP